MRTGLSRRQVAGQTGVTLTFRLIRINVAVLIFLTGNVTAVNLLTSFGILRITRSAAVGNRRFVGIAGFIPLIITVAFTQSHFTRLQGTDMTCLRRTAVKRIITLCIRLVIVTSRVTTVFQAAAALCARLTGTSVACLSGYALACCISPRREAVIIATVV